MKIKHKITTLCLLLAVLPSIPAYATQDKSSIENRIKQNSNFIEQGTLYKEQLQGEIELINEEMKTISKNLANLLVEVETREFEISELDKSIELQEKAVRVAEEKVKETEGQIKNKLEEIKEKQIDLDKHQEMLNVRVREAYKQNTQNKMITLLIESESLIDLFDRLAFIEKMTKQDNKDIDAVNKIISEIEKVKLQLVEEREILKDKQSVLEDEKETLMYSKKTLNQEKESMELTIQGITILEEQKAKTVEAMNKEELQIAQDIGDIMDENSQLEKDLKDILRQEQSWSGSYNTDFSNVSTAGFMRPVSGRVTSPYGPRIHPISNLNSFHTGIDYASPSGTPISATKDGVVISSRYMGSYGNAVIIDHGDGVSSLYSHMSSFAVNVGDQVYQGQPVGGIGSTGNSTGPHLHFEIRVNGQHVNPANFVN